ncbi:hypothetical protein JCM14244_17190 [Venenivibrio stagnispumantis]|uniref:Uncharacterized protein n=1 Tax=Venenivibrio stagnispumantis TaxID=407998 RepID=A0AA45WPS3_9AQUI|nr:hypothetical protein [Venenivibrio stagnispumantis]MCW4573960.1 hypothetical protein [Venenivibrio stagnispumantis]SMP22709.1 hypothetical protein SAMN06264868_12612 [Venenivibrio stagnispumantis]
MIDTTGFFKEIFKIIKILFSKTEEQENNSTPRYCIVDYEKQKNKIDKEENDFFINDFLLEETEFDKGLWDPSSMYYNTIHHHERTIDD